MRDIIGLGEDRLDVMKSDVCSDHIRPERKEEERSLIKDLKRHARLAHTTPYIYTPTYIHIHTTSHDNTRTSLDEIRSDHIT